MSDHDELDSFDDETTAAGLPERRRTGYVTRSEFSKWRNRAAGLFLLLGAIAAAAAFAAYKAGENSDAGLQRAQTTLEEAQRDSSYTTCLSGAELRIAIAGGFDELRRLAIIGAPRDQLELFIARTQPAIDRLLSQAAGRVYNVKLPSGEVTDTVASEVMQFADGRCIKRSIDQYGSRPQRLR